MSSHLANSFKKSSKPWIKYSCTVHSRTRVSKQEKTVKDINRKNYVKELVGQTRVDNPFTLIRTYSSKRYSSFLYDHVEPLHCHVDVRNYNHCRD